jgi:sec-independent protein translocase protein TatC
MATETEEPRTEETEQEEEEGGPVKPFLEHLEDLRWVLIKSGVALAVAMLVCLVGANAVVEIIKRPLRKIHVPHPKDAQVVDVLLGTNIFGPFFFGPEQQETFGLGTNRRVRIHLEPVPNGSNQFLLAFKVQPEPSGAEAHPAPIPLVNFGPVGAFFVAFQVAFYGGLGLASPFIFYFVASFVFPALRMKEKKYVYRGLMFGASLFAAGVLFCYLALMPLALAASMKYSEWLGFSVTQWRAEEYISFVCKFMLGMGLGFELPVVILTLVKIGVLNYRMLSKGRRYMIVINLILGAILTTPEVITQVIMFIPLQLLYEISIWVAWYWERREKKREAAMMQGAKA